ncbi:protein SHQ1 homolog [Nesidiocoris tenuis]|uniref:Protein SHQ1 homolog n=1 Tax=Nesidiocoris tenuis TaxID=355587 RepID=A0ABN7B3B0_9HEMI|nr:protein SHQ1 homolog [Nesidiocoris tenuis]
MLTPFFELKQSEEHVILEIKAPLANIQKTELIADDFNVYFHAPPYYLRLKLPGRVRENERESGQYDATTGVFTFKLEKVDRGSHFEDLDLIGKFLFASKKYQARPTIEVLNEDSLPAGSDTDEEDEFWISRQPKPDDVSSTTPGYGFANKTRGNGQALKEEFFEIIELSEIENTPIPERASLREAYEKEKFSDDHYLADFMEPGEITALIEFKAPWDESFDKKSEVKLTAEETTYLKDLGNREYLLDSEEKRTALLSLADLIFSYAYQYRTFGGENTVESGWTINKLSSTLSWFQSYNSVKDVKLACVRRALIYPLYRHFDLSMRVVEDTLKILKLGRRQILKCLIEIHKIFNSSEPRYLLNQLYVTDYCIWLQKISDRKIESLARLFEQEIITKDDIGLELEELEQAATVVLKEEMESVNKMMSHVSLEDRESGTSEEDASSTDDDADSDSDTVTNQTDSDSDCEVL